MDETNTTARALRCLELLQDRPGISASQLGAELGVTDRAARRYVSVLRAAGVAVESQPGRYGGYRLGRGLRLPPMVFSSEEALGIVMALLDGHHDLIDPGDPVGRASEKILRALPSAVAAEAASVQKTARAVPDRQGVRPSPAVTVALVRAAAEHRCAEIDYRTQSGSAWSATVNPWAVVVRHGRWYLLCERHSTEAPAVAQRAYRVDRVGAVRETGCRFEPPAGLDPVIALEEHLAQGWEYRVEVLIHDAAEPTREWLPSSIGRLEPVSDASCRLVGTTGNPSFIIEHLVRLPMPFEVLGGPELRHVTREIGQRLVEATT